MLVIHTVHVTARTKTLNETHRLQWHRNHLEIIEIETYTTSCEINNIIIFFSIYSDRLVIDYSISEKINQSKIRAHTNGTVYPLSEFGD